MTREVFEKKINEIIRTAYYDDDANLDEAVKDILKVIDKHYKNYNEI